MSGKPSDRKYQELAANLLIERFGDSEGAAALAKLVSFVRLTLTDPDDREALTRLIVRFGLDDLWDWDPQVLQSLVQTLLQHGEEAARKQRKIDFTDMIYLPVKLGLKGPQYDYVLVDEAQDLSPCQRALVLSALKPGGTFIAVGDRRQAIYGFAGASLHSIDEIVEATGAVEMPLSICYRCAPEIVRVAAAIFPGIEPWEQAAPGRVEVLSGENIVDLAQEGDAVLCRTNAPLVSLCLRLLRNGKRALMRGRDLGSSITSLLEKILKRFDPSSIDALYAAVERFLEEEIARLLGSRKSYDEVALQIEAVKDRVDTLIILLDAYMAVFSSDFKPPMARYVEEGESRPSIEGFREALDCFFQRQSNGENGNPHLDAVTLSTVHRAKGQEWPRVFILEWDKMPHPKAVRAEEKEQEEHLRYVAVTRAKRELYLCYSPGYEGDPNALIPCPSQLQRSLPRENEETHASLQPDQADSVMTPVVMNGGEGESENGVMTQASVSEKESEEPLPAGPQWVRKRVKWQGTFSSLFLAFLEAMQEEGHNKSQLVEEIVFSSPQFHAWMQQQHAASWAGKTGAAVSSMSSENELAPETPVASDESGTAASKEPPSSVVNVVAVPFEGWPDQGPQPATRRVFFICRSWRSGNDGKRRRCGHRWAYDYLLSPEGVYERVDGEGHRHSLAEDQATRRCPQCKQTYVSVRVLRSAYRPGTRCTNTCRQAVSDHCECVCGGRNHGIQLVHGPALYRGAKDSKETEP
jgi:hypothetical protein